MLYNQGDQFNQIYYRGKPVSQIWKDGKCIYPGLVSHIAIMTNFISLSSEVRQTITSIVRSTVPPSTNIDVIDVSGSISGYDFSGKYITINSTCPIYMWVHETILYWYSIAKEIKIVGLGGLKSQGIPDKTFYYYNNLTDISGLHDWDISWVHNTFARLVYPQYFNTLIRLFYMCTSLSDFSPIYLWDTSKISSTSQMFWGCRNMISDSGLLQHWDLSSITIMDDMFRRSGLVSTPQNDWNSSRTASKTAMFGECVDLVDISSLIYLDASNCDISGLFFGATKLISAINLHWRMNNTASTIFESCSSLKCVDFSLCEAPNGLIQPEELFYECTSLEICDMGNIFSATYKPFSTGAFYNCPKLSTIIFRNIDNMVVRDNYDGLFQYFGDNHGIIYVPSIQLNNYLLDIEWGRLISAGAQILPLEGSPYEQPGSVSAMYS